MRERKKMPRTMGSRATAALSTLVCFVTLQSGSVYAQTSPGQHGSSNRKTIQVPSFSMTPVGTSTRPLMAAEVANITTTFQVANMVKLSLRSEHYPIDSALHAASVSSKEWLTSLQREPITGIQIDPSGRVGVTAGEEAYAKQQFAKRLATSGLPLRDRAYTLRTAVLAFTNIYIPKYLPIAESYLIQLDALGDSAAAWQFDARKQLLWTYYLLGRSRDVIRLGEQSIDLLGKMQFVDRVFVMYMQTEDQVYSPTVEALTGQPNAQARIERLNVLLRSNTVPTPALVALDSAYTEVGAMARRAAESYITGNAKLGTPAAALIANYWINTPSPDSAIMPVNDGKIRLIEIAHTGCLPCVHELYALERFKQKYPEIQPTLLTWTFGYWGNRLIEPEEEVKLLTDYFVTNTKVTFPVGIWAGKKVPNGDGGMSPEEAPNFKDYPMFGKPMLWIVDGKGMIRRVFTGYSREIETQIARTVEFLLHESKQQ